MPWRAHREWLIGGALALAALAAHGRDIGSPFLGLDDPGQALAYPMNLGLSWTGGVWAWTNVGGDVNWVPLARLSHMLDNQLFGRHAWGHHLVSVLFHAANAVLIWLALRALTGATWRSALVGLLLAVHPVHVESVAWIAERRDVLSLFFGCLALLAYARYARRPGWWRYALVWLAASAAMLAKPSMVTLPCVFLLLDAWPIGRWREALAQPAGRRGGAVAMIFAEKLPIFAVSALSAYLTIRAQASYHEFASFDKLPMELRLINVVRAYAGYLGFLVWSVKLSPMYINWYLWSTPVVIGEFLILAAITALAVAMRRERAYLLIGWLWFIGTLVPMIGLVQVGAQSLACRYAYLSFIGLYVMIAWGLADVVSRWRRETARKAGVALAAAVVVAGVAGSWMESGYWGDGVKLFELAEAESPPSAIIEELLGSANAIAGRMAAAQLHWRKSLCLKYEQGNLLEWLPQNMLEYPATPGRPAWDQIEGLARQRAKLGSPPARTLQLLGMAAAVRGDAQGSLEHFAEAHRLDPNEPTYVFRMAQCYQKLGQMTQAVTYFTQAAQMAPENANYWRSLGLLLANQREYARAIQPLHRALAAGAVGPAEVWNALGISLENTGQREEAESAYAKAVELDPGNAAATVNLARLRKQPPAQTQGRVD